MKQKGSTFSKFRTGCLVLVLILGVVYIGLVLVQCAHSKSSTPDSKTAPYTIQVTGGRTWLALDGEITTPAGQVALSTLPSPYSLKDNESVVLINWYDSQDGKKWKFHKGNSPVFNKNAFAEIIIKRR